MNKPTWHTTAKGARVIWTRKSRNSLVLHLGTVSGLGRNQGEETLVRIVLDEDQKEHKVRIGDLEWVNGISKVIRGRGKAL